MFDMADNGRYPGMILEAIRKTGKTKTKVALEAGLTPEQLNDILNNRRWLRVTELLRIAEVTGASFQIG